VLRLGVNSTMPSEMTYQMRLADEERIFRNCAAVHSLPPIFHYWSNKYVRPKLEAVGFRGLMEVFSDSLERQCQRRQGHPTRFLSIGAGNCDMEIKFALALRTAGYSQFVVDCLDLNEDMLERGVSAASDQGVAEHLNPMAADFNEWHPSQEYDGVIAIHVLHHVLNLEGLLAGIKRSLRAGGCFAIADIIGRNGHLRWPEAMLLVREYWRQLPPSYRFNHQLRRYEEVLEDWDCSALGFEGIRSQDILPLLIENFHFQRFVAFGNVIEPFVDRRFGPNFDASAHWDRAFIDEVHRRDEQEMIRGNIKPTQIVAVLGTSGDQAPLIQEPFSPAIVPRMLTGRQDRRRSILISGRPGRIVHNENLKSRV
jgi:SAM-dependent methyltransferase